MKKQKKMQKISKKFIERVGTDLGVKLDEVLGEGAFGKVYKCTQTCSATNGKLAAKLSTSVKSFESDK